MRSGDRSSPNAALAIARSFVYSRWRELPALWAWPGPLCETNSSDYDSLCQMLGLQVPLWMYYEPFLSLFLEIVICAALANAPA
jgi:hypothetical protein